MNDHPIILVVEDCPVTALLFERVILTHLPTCRPIWARNLAEAWMRVSGLSISLFVLDVNLPDGSGLDFLWQMSTSQPHAHAVVITSHPLPEYQAQSAALGALRFVEKPVSTTVIQTMLSEALAASTTNGADAFRASLMNLTFFDILQLKCLAGATTLMEFASDGQLGTLHLRDGNIVHAKVDTMEGIPALHEISRWRTGTARELPLDTNLPETIDRPWQSLMMQLAQAVDEKRQS